MIVPPALDMYSRRFVQLSFVAERVDIIHFVDSLAGDHPQRAADATIENFSSIYCLQSTVYNIYQTIPDN